MPAARQWPALAASEHPTDQPGSVDPTEIVTLPPAGSKATRDTAAHAVPTVIEQPPAGAAPFALSTDRPRTSATHKTAAKKPGRQKNRAAIIGGGLAVAIVLAVAAAAYFGLPKRDQVIAGGKTKTAGTQATKLVFSWPEDERKGAAVFLDGKKQKLPLTGDVEFKLAKGKHDVIIVRRGFDQIEESIDLTKGGVHTISPKFAPLPLWAKSIASLREGDSLRQGVEAEPPAPAAPKEPPKGKPGPYDDWLQDYEAARQLAAKEKKDLLILFDGSDWCGYSMRMTQAVFSKSEFREGTKADFVLVFIDFPRSPGAKAKVQNADRNRQLSERFGVGGFPTIILADSEGRPYGIDNYQSGDAKKYVQRLAEWKEVRQDRDRLLGEVAAATGKAKLDAAAKAVELLYGTDLADYYERELSEWTSLAQQQDPDNKQGLAEVYFEASWKVRARKLGQLGTQRLVQVAEELDAWTKNRTIKDADRGASMFQHAAYWMMSLERHDLASRYVERALTFKPPDVELHAALLKMQRSIQSVVNEKILASGSGFVVAEGGYILTNEHVLEGSQTIMVRFPDRDRALPAKLVARDPEHDMALIKVDDETAQKAPPVAVADASLGRGASVGAFGYPLNDVVGEGLKLTPTIVSATNRSTPHGLMVLDCKINPGNSGGPLCTNNGCAAGMVTFKSKSGADLETSGMALPAETIIAFLKKHLPGYNPPSASAAAAGPGWDAVDQRVGPSVVLILKGK
jgi:S1-C subfamily serine protease